jgi:hypothetical protein
MSASEHKERGNKYYQQGKYEVNFKMDKHMLNAFFYTDLGSTISL